KELLGDPSQRREWGAEVEHSPHQRTAVGGNEKVVVIEARECAVHHRIPEMARSVERGDLARQLLRDPEMASPPRHFLAECQEASPSAANDTFPRARRRVRVRVDTSREIEAPRRRSGDVE